MKQYNVGIIGATGMVGQRFAVLLQNHPWFNVSALAASPRSAGKTYEEATLGRWNLTEPLPEKLKNMKIIDAADIAAVKTHADFVFCAVDMKKDEIKALEEAYAKAEIPVMSNNSAHRFTPDVPMLIPELNGSHAEVIHSQRKRLGTARGFIAVKSNCSIQSYVPALYPLGAENLESVAVCTYQAISGAGKTFATWGEMTDNVIPFIGGEEEKSEQEPLKVFGNFNGETIVPAASPVFTAQCLRVPLSDGHFAAAFIKFKSGKKPTKDEIITKWRGFVGEPQTLKLPSAPEHFLTYFDEDNFPQAKLHRGLYGGMGVSLGRLREDSLFDYKFVGLSHNTLRGAAGGAVLMAEYLAAKGYL
ncbi:MAG: aspartate-semialdehyde dehydrogenase [Oscillospiraceae bacterium]|jgi:aspartate-semialdehyde dehydrogenase|nr:aspartate-semialdehyde dehydrogenase [Oscillospiraceae bacterium]